MGRKQTCAFVVQKEVSCSGYLSATCALPLTVRAKQVAVPQPEIVPCEWGHQSDTGTSSGLKLGHLLILASSSSMPELFLAQQPRGWLFLVMEKQYWSGR